MRARKLLPFLVILLLAFAAYTPALFSGYTWDDDQYLTENPNVSDAAGLGRTWTDLTANPQYYPLVFTGFYLEKKLWGLNPLGYHLVNVLFHALLCCLVFVLLRRLSLPFAFAAALLFALHPICAESVAWVAERKNVQSGFFYMLSAFFLFSFFGVDKDAPSGRKALGLYLLAFLFFAMAVLSKSVTSSLPAAMLLLLWYRRGRLAWTDVLVLLPFIALGVTLGAATSWVEYVHVGARGPESQVSIPYRLLVAGKNFWFYPWKVFAPVGFCFNYPRWHIDPARTAQYAWPAAAAGLLLLLFFLRKKIGRGPFTAVAFYAGTLFPALGFVDAYPFRFSFVADHFAYLPVLGLIVLLAAGLQRLPKRSGAVALALVAAFLFFQTRVLARSYHDQESLWRHTLQVNPDSAFARRHLAYALALSGDMASALDQMFILYSRHPGEKDDPREEAAALSDLGVILSMKGKNREALDAFQRAAAIAPDYAKARQNLGAAFLSRRMYLKALENFEAAARVRPDYFAAAGSFLSALDEYEKFMAGPAPNDPRAVALYEMGLSSLRSGNEEQAADLFRQALRYQPGYATVRADLGAVLLGQGRTGEAENELSQAVCRSPGSAKAHMNLAAVLAEKGDNAGAEAELRRALALNPYWPKAMFNLSVVLGREGKKQESLDVAVKARDLSDFIGGLYIYVGRTMVEKNLASQAVDFLQKGLALKENDLGGMEALAQALWNTGRQEAANRIMDRVRLFSRQKQGAAPAAPEAAPLTRAEGPVSRAPR